MFKILADILDDLLAIIAMREEARKKKKGEKDENAELR